MSSITFKNMKGNPVKIPEYITKEEVRRVCRGLKFRDWTKLKTASVLSKEAKAILAVVNAQKMKIDQAYSSIT